MYKTKHFDSGPIKIIVTDVEACSKFICLMHRSKETKPPQATFLLKENIQVF